MRKFNQMKKRNIIFASLLLFGIAFFIFLFFHMPRARREDYRQLLSQQYDTVFFSMYPVDTYQVEDFLFYRGMTVFKSSCCIPDLSVLKQYMRLMARSGNIVSTVYLGIRPDITDPESVQKLIASYPGSYFEIILAYPSAEYWRSLSEEEYISVLEAYNRFITAAPAIPNSHFYFMGAQEWLINNPGNYCGQWLVNESVAQSIMLHSDYLHEYFITEDNSSSFSLELTELTHEIRSASVAYPDLSDYNLIFLGDSVIGNCIDSTSIPGIAAAFTNAKVFNCGLGGFSAARNSKFSFTLPEIASALAEQNCSRIPEETQVYQGLSSYLALPVFPEEKTCFILYYGLNDYFNGYPVSSETDPYDPATYSGAIRTAVTILRSRFPDAQIILCTPNYISYYDHGTMQIGEGNYILEDYVDAVFSLSEELHTDILDTYRGFDVNRGNWMQYLPDQVHPNEAFRYLIGEKIISLIR